MTDGAADEPGTGAEPGPEVTPAPEPALDGGAAPGPEATSEHAAGEPAGAGPAVAGPGSAQPVPLDVPLEDQISSLPPLTYPGNPMQEVKQLADERRRSRLVIEIAGGGLLLLGGVVAWLLTQRPAFVVVALFGVLGLAAYEFLVDSFQ